MLKKGEIAHDAFIYGETFLKCSYVSPQYILCVDRDDRYTERKKNRPRYIIDR